MGIETLRTGYRVPANDSDETSLYREHYSQNIAILSGERPAQLRGIFPEEHLEAVAEFFVQDAVKPLPSTSRGQQLTERFGDTVWANLQTVQRITAACEYGFYFPMTRKDMANKIHDIKSIAYTKAVQNFNADFDDVIISACTDPVYEQYTLSSTKVKQAALSSLSTDQYLTDAAGLGCTEKRIALINQHFIESEVEIDNMDSYLIIGPKQRTQLKNNDTITSADFVGTHPLTNKSLPVLDGHNILVSNKLGSTTDSAGRTVRNCLCVFSGACKGIIEENFFVKIADRADKGTTMQLAVERSFSFIRIDDNLIVVFQCVEDDSLPDVE